MRSQSKMKIRFIFTAGTLQTAYTNMPINVKSRCFRGSSFRKNDDSVSRAIQINLFPHRIPIFPYFSLRMCKWRANTVGTLHSSSLNKTSSYYGSIYMLISPDVGKTFLWISLWFSNNDGANKLKLWNKHLQLLCGPVQTDPKLSNCTHEAKQT